MGVEKVPAKTIATCDSCGRSEDITEDDSEMIEWASIGIADQTINTRVRSYRATSYLACPDCRKQIEALVATVFKP